LLLLLLRSNRTYIIFVTQFGRLHFDKQLCNRYGQNMLFLTPTYFRCVSPGKLSRKWRVENKHFCIFPPFFSSHSPRKVSYCCPIKVKRLMHIYTLILLYIYHQNRTDMCHANLTHTQPNTHIPAHIINHYSTPDWRSKAKRRFVNIEYKVLKCRLNTIFPFSTIPTKHTSNLCVIMWGVLKNTIKTKPNLT